MSFVMFAADEFGSVAEMPLASNDFAEATALAREWLANYEHGFSHAIVIPPAFAPTWAGQPVADLWTAIVSFRPSRQLI